MLSTSQVGGHNWASNEQLSFIISDLKIKKYINCKGCINITDSYTECVFISQSLSLEIEALPCPTGLSAVSPGSGAFLVNNQTFLGFSFLLFWGMVLWVTSLIPFICSFIICNCSPIVISVNIIFAIQGLQTSSEACKVLFYLSGEYLVSLA